LGSLALLLGVLTRWAAAGLGIVMVGAIFFTRFTLHAALFTTPQGTGLDYNLLILAGCIALIAFGADGWSVDAIGKKASANATTAMNMRVQASTTSADRRSSSIGSGLTTSSRRHRRATPERRGFDAPLQLHA
jgi:hypothetical protein